MRSNGLLKWLMIPVAILVLFVGIRLFSGGGSTAPPAEDNGAQLTPDEMKALGIEGDTPRDTVATLVAQFGTRRLQLIEDAVQEALVRALQTWPYRGVPDNAAAWLTQAARNVMLDQLRREQRWQEREEGVAAEKNRWSGNADDAPASDELIRDDTLRLICICCHPHE